MGVARVLKNIKGPSVEELMAAQDHVCAICRKSIRGAVSWTYPGGTFGELIFNDDYVSFDHVIPESKGGPIAGNVLLAHPSCNIEKDDRMPTAEELDMLARVNALLGWNGRYYENTQARRKMMFRRRFRGKEHHDYRDDPRYVERRASWRGS